MSERVTKWQGLTIAWPRDPRTFASAINRLRQTAHAISWMLRDLEGGERERERLRAEIRHYTNLLTARWNANDALLATSECDCGQHDCANSPAPAEGERGWVGERS